MTSPDCVHHRGRIPTAMVLVLLLIAQLATPCAARRQPVGPLPYADPGNTLGISYSGHYSVNSTSYPQVSRGIFYWYFPPQNEDPDAPIIIWFQGGPGSSSMLGLFYLNGPLRFMENDTVTPAEVTWNKEFGMLFIDNPVGTGYSYVEGLGSSDETGFVTTEEEVGRDIYVMLRQFYEDFPELVDNDLYITGESYAGKYCPAVSEYIRRMNEVEDFKINLVGTAIGNGLTDPKAQVNSLAEHVYNIGLIDAHQASILETHQKDVADAIDREDWLAALSSRNTIYNLITLWTGGVNYYDVRRYESDDFSQMDRFLNLPSVMESLNVDNHSFYNDPRVYSALQEDIMKSTAPLFPTLMDTYKVLIYTGQWDIRDGIPGTLAWVYELDWEHIEEYYTADRVVWKVNGEVAGFAKKTQQFTEVTLVNAGHMVPKDAPPQASDMITRWIKDIPFK